MQSRLARLASHLISSTSLSEGIDVAEQQLSRAHTASVVTERPTPGGGPGKLLVTDGRTGKKYELEIDEHGQVKGTDLKQIVAGGDGIGLRVYDPGCVCCACLLCSNISHPQLRQRGGVQVCDILHRRQQGHPALPWDTH